MMLSESSGRECGNHNSESPRGNDSGEYRQQRRFKIEHADLPMCIHCARQTTRRCDGGCRMPYCGAQCQRDGLQYHTNYCKKPNF